MKQYPADFWNERYTEKEYVYGTQPNVFFKEQLDQLVAGNVLLPAEGEGRNAVYAALQGWDVVAFDISTSGKVKAMQLSAAQKVVVDYQVTSVLDFKTDIKFDTIGLCYTHFPIEIRKDAFQHLLKFLKTNGTVIFEAFAKAQLGKPSGGPKNFGMLFSIEEIKDEFPELEFKLLEEKTIELSEGNYHKGKAEVIRFIGIKK
ncbi:class I SAM-dependent methyltransferase [Nonlabens ulvanivorans]|uniref:Methyltransferase n=1 Tax=Nonlabens ulvanivorans TaxID=906888 RepID=A0A084JYT3_NONUL|nr:class I SAM-dependent methyltransferase [Nonlabens ulvanivorans]KEZ94117.1 methyltransferase [Nonlabens ulvanivorans]PRX13106.1 thiopurine S-methyltransferase [Nonlabens ulvanivorans]